MNFFDPKGNLKVESFRLYVLDELTQLLYSFESLLATHESTLNSLHDAIAMRSSDEKILLRKIESQIIALPEFIRTWIHTALDSPDRFSLFVQSKSQELDSPDQSYRDYWAQHIRYDQLMALLMVVSDLYKNLDSWLKMPIDSLLSNPQFLNLSTETIEDRIYFVSQELSRQPKGNS